MAFGFGANKSSGSTNSSSRSEDYGTGIWGPQQGYLQNLYQNAQGLAGGPQMGMGGLGNAQQNAQLAQQGLLNSNQNLQGFMNPGVDPAVDAYSQRLGQQFNEQFMPALQGEAAMAGGLGGSRQQIGAALGADRAQQAIGDFASNAYAGQQQRALQAAGQMGQNSQMMGQLGQQNLMNADFSRGMPWYNQQMFSGLLGAPTILDKGGLSTSKSSGSTSSGGFNIGF